MGLRIPVHTHIFFFFLEFCLCNGSNCVILHLSPVDMSSPFGCELLALRCTLAQRLGGKAAQ